MTARFTLRRPAASRLAADDGFSLVFISVMLVVLFGLAGFVTDWGMMWLSRRQAQNAADAGALAGAVARALDEPTEAPTAISYNAAVQAALANKVWKEDPGIDVQWTCPSYVTTPGGRCVQVDVFRDGTHDSHTLPTYFGRLFNRSSLMTKAHAVAQAVPANATTCLRPWAVADRWTELRDPAETFDRYVANGSQRGEYLTGNLDVYVPPEGRDEYSPNVALPPGEDDTTPTGYTNASVGTQKVLMYSNASGPVGGGWFLAVDIPRADGAGANGADRYRENIQSCNGIATHIGQYLKTETGAMVGPTMQGVRDLIALDPDAHWEGDGIAGSCGAGSPCEGSSLSPRVVAIALFDPDDFAYRTATNDTSVCPGGGQCVLVRNIFAFFLEGFDEGGNVTGRIMESIGDFDNKWDVLPPQQSFLWTVRLVQ